MSIENILRKLRESRMNEATEEFKYVFDIPWRETISDYYSEVGHHYSIYKMDYSNEIMSEAMEDFNDSDLAKFASRDSRTENCGILKMTMDFNKKGHCEVTVSTSQILDQNQIEDLIDYLEGQMADGWGEEFEQRKIASFTEKGEGGYYETNDITYYVSGQFWWHDDTRHPYEITLVRDPGEIGERSNESAVYSPYDQSDRDNSDYHKLEKNREEDHPYVGKKVRWSEDGRTYRVTGAYEDSRGVIVRCGDITMKPDEYKIIK